MRSGQIIDQLAATTWTLVAFLEFFFDEVFRLWTSTPHLLLVGETGLLGPANLPAYPVISATWHGKVVPLLSGRHRRVSNFSELFLVS